MSHAVPLLLEMERINKHYGATQALKNVSFQLRSGEAMALIGENGAGKSTLMKVLCGAVAPDGGTMQLDGVPFRPRGPHSARAAGVAMIYQELNLAPDLSVEDNIMLGQEASRCGVLLRSVQRPRVRQALHLLGHPELRPELPVRSLSVAAQQLVEIARALVRDTRLIVFDEPTSSLTRRDVEHLFGVIHRLKQANLGIVYISHFLEEIRQVCDRFTVLRDGATVGAGGLAGAGEREIVSLMVGRSVDELFPKIPHKTGATVLRVQSLSGREIPQDITLELRRGEILGVSGLVGAGRTELLRAIFSLAPVRRGVVKVREVAPAANPGGTHSGRAWLRIGRSQGRGPRAKPLDRRQHDAQLSKALQPLGAVESPTTATKQLRSGRKDFKSRPPRWNKKSRRCRVEINKRSPCARPASRRRRTAAR